MDSVAEHRDRKTYLGGHCIGSIIGVNKYKGPFTLWEEKLGLRPGPEQSKAMLWGLMLEPFVAQLYANRTGYTLVKGGFVSDPEYPFLGGSPDYYIQDDPELGMDCKTAGEDQLWDGDWGPDGSDEIPDPYMVQGQWYMGLSGKSRWDIHVAFLGRSREDRLYHLAFNPELFATLKADAIAFWNDHILTKIPPVENERDYEALRESLARKALARKDVMDPTSPAIQAAVEYHQASEKEKAAKAQKDLLKLRILKELQATGAQKFKGLDWSSGITKGKLTTVVDHEAVLKDVLKAHPVPAEELTALEQTHTSKKEGAPYLSLYFGAKFAVKQEASK